MLKPKRKSLSEMTAGLTIGQYVDKLERVIPTEIEALDRLLPNGGLPRGHLCEMVGERGSGRTSFVVNMAARLAREGERTAIIDMERDLDPVAFSQAGIVPGAVWVVFPSRLNDALWSADLLLRSGHFGLVVLDGLDEPVRTSSLVRLQRQARETETALLIGAARRTLLAPGSTRLRFRPAGVEWEEGLGGVIGPQSLGVAVSVSKGKEEVTAHFTCRDEPLLGNHPNVPDRRGAKWTENRRRRRNSSKWPGAKARRNSNGRRPKKQALHSVAPV